MANNGEYWSVLHLWNSVWIGVFIGATYSLKCRAPREKLSSIFLFWPYVFVIMKMNNKCMEIF